MNNIQGLPPFKRFCVTIGNLPSSYVDSMSYYECLMWLCNYLQNTVVPAVNENAEAVNELINWFNNLNVQDEIDNKLDEMVEDGTLATIINQEVFGQINDDITALQGDITRIDGDIDDVNDEIDFIKGDRTVILGDSYGMVRAGLDINGWEYYLQELLGLDNNNCFRYASSGSGFCKSGDYGTFLQLLESARTLISDHNTIKNIIVAGGLNDREYTQDQIGTAIEAFVSYCATEYPNAKVYIGHIGNNKGYESAQQLERLRCRINSIPAYQHCSKYGAIYLNGVELIMNDYSEYYDNSHPNDTASKRLASGIYQALKNGYCTVSYGRVNALSITSSILSGSTIPFSYNLINGMVSIENLTQYSAELVFTSNQTTDGLITLGTIDCKYVREVFPFTPAWSIEATIVQSDNTAVNVSAQLFIGGNTLYFRFSNPTGSSYTLKSIRIRNFQHYIPAIYC